MDERDPDEFDTPRAARLTALMERAVADDHGPAGSASRSEAPTPQRTPRRWAVTALATAAVITLVAAGVVAVVRDDDRTSTLETADGVPASDDRSSMWRVPTELPEGMTLDSASVTGALDVLVAIDDHEAPDRVLIISFVAYGIDAPVLAEDEVGSATVFTRRAPALRSDPQGPEDGELFHTAITGPTRSYAVASVLAAGIDEEEIRRVTTELAAAIPPEILDPSSSVGHPDALDTVGALTAAVEAVDLPDGMFRVGSWDMGRQPMGSLTVSIARPAGGGCAVTLQPIRPEPQRRITEGMLRRTTMGSVHGLGTPAGPETDGIEGDVRWLEVGPPSATTSRLLQVFDGGTQIGVNCFTEGGDRAPDEWAIELAESLEPVADETAFRAAMGQRGVTVTGG